MGRLLAWLLDALVLYFIVSTISRLVRGGRSMSGAPRSPQNVERSGGTLVRDPQCGTYVPENRAIQVIAGDKTLYFCSTTCRDAYQART
jgi:uncharacterized protein